MGSPKSSGEIILDRRRASRNPFEAKATITLADAAYSVLTRDLTPKSAWIVTDLLLPESTPVELTLEIGDGLDSIDVIGRVVRVASEAEGAAGFAVEFDAIEVIDAERIIEATHGS